MKFNFGHLSSQKFAALIFAILVCFGAGFAFSHDVFSTLVMGIVALYTAFVGGRAWSDGQAIKFGQLPSAVDASQKAPAPPVVKKAALTAQAPKEDAGEVD